MKSYHVAKLGEKGCQGFVLTKHLRVVAVSWQKPNQARLDCMVGVCHLK